MRKNKHQNISAKERAINWQAIKQHSFYLLAFLFIFINVQNYVFNKKVDKNGDNASYYIGAMSIFQGDGYANILSPDKPKTNTFPPGYSYLMSLAMHISTSFITQKILNIVFLGLTCILLYLIIFRQTKDYLLSFVIGIFPTFNHSILQFSTKMMSESSFLFFSFLAIFALFKLKESKTFKQLYKDPYFYILLLSSSFAYHIRTQGISLIIAIIVFLLIKKNWKQMLSFTFGFFISILPWMIRNKLANVGSSRYVEKIFAVNHWRPDEGLMSLSEMISRMFKTIKMLITQAIPDSIIPNYIFNYKEDPTTFMWIIGIIIIPLIILGYLRYFKKEGWFFILYIVFNCMIIALWSAPSRNRYLIGFLPIIQTGLILGLIGSIELMLSSLLKLKLNRNILIGILIFISFSPIVKDIQLIAKENQQKMHPAYKNFYKIAQTIKKKHPEGNAMVCSRKPTLFYLYSHTYNCSYKFSTNDTVIVQDLIDKKTDYVILEQLGYSSTSRYLYPTIQKHPLLFKPILHLKKPDTYLIWFDRAKAKLMFKQ